MSLRRAHCAKIGVDISALERYTDYPGWRCWRATEICGFSIFSGSDRLIAIAEQIVLRFVLDD